MPFELLAPEQSFKHAKADAFQTSPALQLQALVPFDVPVEPVTPAQLMTQAEPFHT
jgi:nitrate reductase gamma subunit